MGWDVAWLVQYSVLLSMHEVLSSNLNNSCELNIVPRWQVLRLLILQDYKARRGSRMRFYLVLRRMKLYHLQESG